MNRVSVIIPVRNEVRYIRQTIDSVLAQDYPSDLLEIIIADGLSDDGTREVVTEYSLSQTNVSLIDNHGQIVPTGLNKAIKMALGDVIVRMDCHSVYPQDYITVLVKALGDLKADNVGGVVRTVPAGSKLKNRAIAIAISHPFGVGNSYFRIGSDEIKEVDTVPFGCFKRDVFERIGYFDEQLVRNQDDELNARMRKHGLKIYLIPNVVVDYYARDKFKFLYRMFYQYGLFKPLVNLKLGRFSSWRQLIPFAFVLFLFVGGVVSLFSLIASLLYAAGLATYILANIAVSVRASLGGESFVLPFYLFVSFFIVHFSYGIGYLTGIFKLIAQRSQHTTKVDLSR